MSRHDPLATALELVDLERYPLNDLDSEQGRALVVEMREALERTGAASLPGFLRADALAEMVAEAETLAPLAFGGPLDCAPTSTPPWVVSSVGRAPGF